MKQVHFIGIGGIGVSALAQYYLATGWQVSGSDAVRSEVTDDLKKKGARIFIGQRGENLKRPDLVVYSAAIESDNPEFSQAQIRGYPLLSYAQAVGELTKKYFTIAVSGSHGKSTTTALIGLMLIEAGFDPTIIIGTKLKELGDPSTMLGASNNFRLGRSKYLVLEADEYAHSFHNYFPQIAVVTNIDKEHLDVYKNLAGVIRGFKRFFKNISKDGYLVANKEDKSILSAVRCKLSAKLIWYKKGNHGLSIPGAHNQFNAEAAWQAVKLLGVRKSVAEKVFRTFGGAWRRLELLATSDKRQATRMRKHVSCRMSQVSIYSDYAHHPTEIKATLQALKEKHPGKKIVCVFQPHQQDRLNRLFKEFTRAFVDADFTIIYPLYQVMGRDTVGKTSEDLAKAIDRPSVVYVGDFKSVLRLIKPDTQSGAVIVFMSAGDLDNTARKYFVG